MKTLYFDCFSGISGNMTLGALLDIGVEERVLLEGLKLLGVSGYELKIEKKLKNGIMGTYLEVELEQEKHSHDHDHSVEVAAGHSHHMNDRTDHMHDRTHEHRSYKDIVKLIDDSSLNDRVKQLSKKIFAVIAEAEGKIHGKPVAEVHFHEVGAVDSIVDIVGTAICIDALGIESIVFSSLPLSRGFVKCQHGVFPLPAPATLEILKDTPVYYNNAGFELVTPTGAAIVKALGSEHGELGNVMIDRIGYGLGKKTYEVPNVLRVIIFDAKKKLNDEVVRIDTNIDDMTGEQLGFLMDKLLSEGALDVYFTSIYMKKNRPAVMLSILCDVDKREYFTKMLLKHTSTFGVRYTIMKRDILERRIVSIDTSLGAIRFKVGIMDGEVIKYSPEYEDCKAASEKYRKPIQKVFEAMINEYSRTT